MSANNGAAAKALRDEIGKLYAQRDKLDEQRAQLVAEISRYESALSALDGVFRSGGKGGAASTRKALIAALASFHAPVSTQTLLDHPDLTHYSRSTLRSTLSDMKARGEIAVAERTPHGNLWAPLQ